MSDILVQPPIGNEICGRTLKEAMSLEGGNASFPADKRMTQAHHFPDFPAHSHKLPAQMASGFWGRSDYGNRSAILRMPLWCRMRRSARPVCGSNAISASIDLQK